MLISNHWLFKVSLLKRYIIQFRIFETNISQLNFFIIDVEVSIMIIILLNMWTASFYYVFLYLACFVVSTYVIFIWVCWIPVGYASLITCLFTRFRRHSVGQSRNDHMQAYVYNGRQIELFHMKWSNCGYINWAYNHSQNTWDKI